MAIEILEKTFSSFVKNSPETTIMADIRMLLNEIIDDSDENSYLSLKDVLTGDKYLQDIAIKHQNYSYEYVQKDSMKIFLLYSLFYRMHLSLL